MADDPEIEAMSRVAAALTDLDDAARSRVIMWCAGRFGVQISGGQRSSQASMHPGAGGTGQSPSAATEYETLAELFSAIGPKTDAQKALVVAYWLQVRQGSLELDSQSINSELKHLGYGVSNITSAMDDLKSKRPALAIQLKKAGSTRQARKKYKVTDAGTRAVEAMLREE